VLVCAAPGWCGIGFWLLIDARGLGAATAWLAPNGGGAKLIQAKSEAGGFGLEASEQLGVSGFAQLADPLVDAIPQQLQLWDIELGDAWVRSDALWLGRGDGGCVVHELALRLDDSCGGLLRLARLLGMVGFFQ
jgi:hypothetical protein